MATGSSAMLVKNLRNLFEGCTTFLAQSTKGLSTYKVMKERQQALAPEDYRNQAEVYEEAYWKRHLCQEKNFWVDGKLGDVMTRQQLAEYHEYRQDLYKMGTAAVGTAMFGGWGLLAWPLWLSNDVWVPKCFNRTPEEVKAWRLQQDMYRYKMIPFMLSDFRWWFEFHVKIPTQKTPAWEEIFEKNDVRRDPTLCSSLSPNYVPFFCIRRKQARAICRAMGFPTFPFFGKICGQTRIRDYWEIAFAEDIMVMQSGVLESLTEEELISYAWRRFLTPVDKNLTRDEILTRVRDYHAFLGGETFLQTHKAPNLFLTIAYCMGHYNEPSFLTNDISELEADDFAHLKDWGRDAFQRRLEFENGPLRDQVEAHSIKQVEERQRKLAEPVLPQ